MMGTSKNSASSPNAIKLPANDSASFSFRFIYVHSGAVSDRQWEQFFEVPSCLFAHSGSEPALGIDQPVSARGYELDLHGHLACLQAGTFIGVRSARQQRPRRGRCQL